LIQDIRACNPAITSFDASCFDGQYITGGVTPEYLASIEASRADNETRGASDSGSDTGNESGASSYQLDLGLSTVEQ
jgi:amidophosphoribosyltransferase